MECIPTYLRLSQKPASPPLRSWDIIYTRSGSPGAMRLATRTKGPYEHKGHKQRDKQHPWFPHTPFSLQLPGGLPIPCPQLAARAMDGIAAYPWIPRGVRLPASDIINDQQAMKEAVFPLLILRRYDRLAMDLTLKLMQ
eukprot:12643036-Heterocapsa_arctica.AAC.1